MATTMVTGKAVQQLVAGAIYDFMGWLTTREKPITLGSNNDCAAVPPLIEEWAATRGLDTSNADVMGWSTSRESAPRDQALDGLLELAYALRSEYDVGDAEFGVQQNDSPERLTNVIARLEELAAAARADQPAGPISDG